MHVVLETGRYLSRFPCLTPECVKFSAFGCTSGLSQCFDVWKVHVLFFYTVPILSETLRQKYV